WERQPDMWKMPVLFSMTCQRKGEAGYALPNGFPMRRLAMRAAQNYDLAALGFNCGREIRMEDLARMARTLGPGIRMGFVRPNAGTPTMVAGRWQYPHTAAAMAEALPTLFERGVR